MCSSHPRMTYTKSQVVDNRVLAEQIHELIVFWKGPEPQAGQFFMLKAERSGVLLGRPISLFWWEPQAFAETALFQGKLSFLIAARGRGSRELCELQKGDTIDLIGPLGTAWPEPEGSPSSAQAAKAAASPPRIALVGGGVGLAPLICLARTLPPRSYDLYAGFRSEVYGLEGIDPQKLVIATEDGSHGERGRIPAFFNPAPYHRVYTCGPEPMLELVSRACQQAGVPCYVSMERRMACGVGACLGCTIPTRSGNKRCCVEGPIFDSRELFYE